MKTLLLLAGQSKRFWPLSEKPFFPICGKALLSHVIDRLKQAGCDDVILIGGKHNLEEAKRLFPDLPMVEQERLELGMRGALLSALPKVGNEPVLIVSANDIIEPDAYEMTVSAGAKCDGAILGQIVSRYFPGGYLSHKDNHMTSIIEKPGAGNEPSDMVTIVCHYHTDPQALLESLSGVDESKDDGYEQALGKLFATKNYTPVPYAGLWQAVKYPWHLLHLLPALLQELPSGRTRHKESEIHETAVIEGNVVIEEGVRILPHAVIIGPSTIGKGTIVGNNALVRGSSIGEKCVIGFGTEVKNSVLASHVWTHSTYIGDSVIGENVSFGAGCVTGNLRLDEGEISSQVGGDKVETGLTKFGTAIGDHCRIGIHVGINPGVKIGRDTFVGGGCMVGQDIPDQSFVSMKGGEIVVRPNTGKAPHPAEREKYKKMI